MTLSANFSTTNLDLRFDQTDRTLAGYLVHSIEAIKPIIDQIKSAGFDAVTLQTNTPIDINTGELDLYVETIEWNRDRSLPDDFWAIADYAKSVGLQVIVKAEIVNSATDSWIHAWTKFGPNWSISKFFESVASYEAVLSAAAQQHSVDGFYIGYNNNGLTTEAYRTQWQHIVDVVRQNFKGSLLYSANYDQKSVVWDMVDIVGLCANPVLSTLPLTDVESIIAKYSTAETGYRSNIVAAFKSIYQQYKKPIIYDGLMINAGDKAIGDLYNNLLWDSLSTTGAVDPTKFELNTQRQALRYKAALELIQGELKDIVDAIEVGEYSAWQLADWIVTRPDSPWGLYARLGFDVLYSSDAVKVFTEYFNQPWGYKTLWYGSTGNDTIASQDGDDLIYVYGGNDTVNGGAGIDTVVISGSAKNHRLVYQEGHIGVKGTDGISSLINVEKIKFDDLTVNIQTKDHASYADLPKDLYSFFIAAFGAVPGVTYMDQLTEAYRAGMSVEDIVKVFTGKSVFTDRLPTTLSQEQFAAKFVDGLVGTTATSAAKQQAVDDIVAAMKAGWTRGDVIYTVFTNLEHKSHDDIQWGKTSKLFSNQLAMAEFYTDSLSQDTTDLARLHAVLDTVTDTNCGTTDQMMVQLTGVYLGSTWFEPLPGG